MTATLAQLAQRPLSSAEMRSAMDQIISGHAAADDVADFLRALASRGETDEEIAGTVASLWMHQAASLPFSSPPPELCDTCGTGGDGKGTFNVSTLAALVAAACGVRICKHGNRAASSRCGSADVLETLGLNLNATPAQIVRSIEEVGFGFCFAPNFHPAMKVVAPIRKTLGIRTIFNLAGPLANPAKQLTYQLVGVSDKLRIGSMAMALQRLGIRHGLVVHGADGLDEVTTTGETQAVEVPSGNTVRLSPVEYGLPRATLAQLQGGDAATNAQIAREVLSGAPSPKRDIVALNAGCIIYTANQAADISEGIQKAVDALESGRARTVLARAIEISRS
jgi:anthranilate phosphoribosyltransferase